MEVGGCGVVHSDRADVARASVVTNPDMVSYLGYLLFGMIKLHCHTITRIWNRCLSKDNDC